MPQLPSGSEFSIARREDDEMDLNLLMSSCMTSAGTHHEMLKASVVGPATSPGVLLHSRLPRSPSGLFAASSTGETILHRSVRTSPGSSTSYPGSSTLGQRSDRGSGTLGFDDEEFNVEGEEELAWWDHMVIWSRGGEFFRRWSFDHLALEGKVSWAGFVWFPVQAGGYDSSSSSSDYDETVNISALAKGKGKFSETFGPFHDSQHAAWQGPKLRDNGNDHSSDAGPSHRTSGLVRTLLVLLKSRGIVYYPSGDSVSLDLPFPISSAFPLCRWEGGGVMLQRQLEKRELRRYGRDDSVLSGLRADGGMVSVLDEVVDLDEGEERLPRVYTLLNPFDELKMVVEAKTRNDRILGPEEPIDPSLSVTFVTEDEYPFVVLQDRTSSEIIFSRRVKAPLNSPAVPLSVRKMRPEDVLKQGTPVSASMGPSASTSKSVRPSLHRTTSGFTATTDRIVSGVDPMDRTRRGPRMSRGAGMDVQPSSAKTEELQATLDPPTLPPPSTAQTRTKGKAGPRESLGEARRTSGDSGMMREEPELGRVAGVAGLGDRDLRDTTMLFGLEREDEGVRSEIVLDRIWVWKPPEGTQVQSICVSDNLTPDMCNINVQASSMLYTFHAERDGLNRWKIHPLFSTPSSSSIPLLSTRHRVFDTLILRDGETKLLTSFGQTLDIQIPTVSRERDEVPTKMVESLSMRLEGDDSMRSVPQISKVIKLEHPVAGRCTVTFDDGEKTRISLDLRIRDGLVRKCFEAIAWVVPREAMFSIKRDYLSRLQNASSSSPLERFRPWKVFATTLLRGFGFAAPAEPPDEVSTLILDSIQSPDPTIRRLARVIENKRGKSSDRRTPLVDWTGAFLDPDMAPPVLLAVHLVAQDRRLLSSTSKRLSQIAELLIRISEAIGRADWSDYWRRIVPIPMGGTTELRPSPLLDQFDIPPDVLSYLSRRLVTPRKPFPSPETCSDSSITEFDRTHPCEQTALIISIYDRLGVTAGDKRSRDDSISARASSTVKYMVERGVTQQWIADLLPGIAMPILEMMRAAQSSPDKTWPKEVFAFIDRGDLAAQVSGMVPAPDTSHESEESVPTIGDIAKSVSEARKDSNKAVLPQVRFGSDRRLQEVERIMQTTSIRTIATSEPKGASDQEIAQYQQNVVNTLANRTLAIPVGQGIFEFGTRNTTITDIWEIPLIELSVKILPAKTVLQAQIVAENADWPCFHNGVAAALSISPDCQGVDSSWIIFNRPHNLNPEHGGFLLGLGLTGHLRSLMTYHAFPYLEPRHDFTSVGLLLGLACSYAGSEDVLVTKVLSLHTHALLPLGSMELNASSVIQSSALLGIGLLYAGSKNVRMAEVALAEVGRKEMPGVDGFVECQEAYSFSASMAFGLIMLGRGGQTSSEVDRRMLVQLSRLIKGEAPGFDGKGGFGDTTLTAPGATLALGLMYLKTGRRDVADTLEIPQTAFSLEQVRPDILLLRTLVRGLIMWDDINPSLAWVDSQIPPFIQAGHKGHKGSAQLELNAELSYFNIIAGACMAIGLKYAGTATEVAHNTLMLFFTVLSKAAAGQSMTYEGKIRRTAARQALSVVTISLAVVMSGTGELNVLRRLRISHGQEGAGVTYGTHMAMHMACGILFLGRGHYTLGSSNLSIAGMAIAFFPRFLPSPGDNRAYPQAFRHLWALAVEPRCLTAKDVETRETIYLPVKVSLREGGQIRQQSLISPTLIAPLDSIISIEVDSPRYWPIAYDLSNPHHKRALVKTRTIYVKRKSGFLDYNCDPKGNRSIFVRAGSMTGFDMHYDLISPATPPSIPAEEVFTLIQAHSGSPDLVAMASHFAGPGPFDAFMRTILLECVSLDKFAMLAVYISIMLSYRVETDSTELLSQLGMVQNYYAIYDRAYNLPTTSGEKRFALIRPNFVASVSRSPIGEQDMAEGEEYLRAGTWGGMDLAKWLKANNAPPLSLLRELRRSVLTDTRRLSEDEYLVRMRDTVDRFIKAVNARWDIAEAAGSHTRQWRVGSMREALQLWTNDRTQRSIA